MFKVRDDLILALTEEVLGRVLKGPLMTRMTELVQEILPGTIHYETIEDSIRHLAGIEVTKKALIETCWHLAGNTKRMANRIPVPPWTVQTVREWVPVQVTACRRGRNGRGDLGATVSLRVLAGGPCPKVTSKWWSLRMCRFIATQVGYGRPRGRNEPKFPYAQPEQLVGLRLYALIDPDESDTEPGIAKIECNATLKEWNQGVVRKRFRVEPGFTCRMGEPVSALPCHQCPIGYAKCPAGTHRATWTLKPCPVCSATEAWFDPDGAQDMCVSCTAAAAYKRS